MRLQEQIRTILRRKRYVCTAALLLILAALTACGPGTQIPEEVKAEDNEDKKGEKTAGSSAYTIEEKERLNDVLHLADDAKQYGDLEKEIDRLMKALQ